MCRYIDQAVQINSDSNIQEYPNMTRVNRSRMVINDWGIQVEHVRMPSHAHTHASSQNNTFGLQEIKNIPWRKGSAISHRLPSVVSLFKHKYRFIGMRLWKCMSDASHHASCNHLEGAWMYSLIGKPRLWNQCVFVLQTVRSLLLEEPLPVNIWSNGHEDAAPTVGAQRPTLFQRQLPPLPYPLKHSNLGNVMHFLL